LGRHQWNLHFDRLEALEKGIHEVFGSLKFMEGFSGQLGVGSLSPFLLKEDGSKNGRIGIKEH
jgi:hypothetical protein